MDTVDLAAMAEALPAARSRLKGLIRSSLHSYSAQSDLRIAADHASRAVEYTASPPPLPAKAVEDIVMALTTSAVVFYARATKSKSNHRSTFDLRPDFDDAEKAEHEYICKLRDDAVAHYGPGPINDTHTLRSDHIVLPPPYEKVMLCSRSLHGSIELGNRIAKQASRAAILMQRIHREKEAELVEELNKVSADADIQEAVERARATLGDAIGDHEIARMLLDGPREGHFRLMSKEPLG